MDQNNSQSAKIAGGIIMTAIVMIGIYFFILNSKPAPQSSNTFSANPSELPAGPEQERQYSKGHNSVGNSMLCSFGHSQAV